jgi:hypothetical protein
VSQQLYLLDEVTYLRCKPEVPFCTSLCHTTPVHLKLSSQGKGVNVNEKDTEGFTALMIAAEYGHKDIVAYLVVRKREEAIDRGRSSGGQYRTIVCTEE